MNWSRLATAMAAACIAVYPASVLAEDSTLVLVVGGEAYDGPPKFEVDFDGKPLGQATVAAAIDTNTVGRFADARDKTPYVQSFTFAVPESVFRAEGAVTIKFLNEAYGGDGSNRDRNLFVASVAINGRVVTASGLETLADGAAAPNRLLGEFLVLPDGSKEGLSPSPQGGWPQPNELAVNQLREAQLPDATVQVADTSPDPVRTGSIARPHPVTGIQPEPLKVALADPNPEASGGNVHCDLSEVYNVVGFNENSNELTARLIRRLDQIATDIGERQCNVQVTGYSSKQGAIASNALFAVERAQNSLGYLLEHGVKFSRASATGVGATDQFGPDYSSNRRVVITVTP
ncbi:MAG: carbohydrate-binding domain-containing protein [Devosia sp.]